MIILSNGHVLQYVVASGALAFDGQGWPWERPLVFAGLIKPELFTVFIKSLTLHPRPGNLRWWKPWTCVKLIPGGSVNKVSLTNPGIDWWCREVGPTIDFKRFAVGGSIFGTTEELVAMAEILNAFDLVALEVNVSCPNTGHSLSETSMVVSSVKAVKRVSRHPVIVKLSVAQPYLDIARELRGIAEAISLNSVPWEIAFPKQRSPLWRLDRRVGGGGGGVSGQPAQKFNWTALRLLVDADCLPVIAPGVMAYEDLKIVRGLGATAFSFGAIHLRTPWKPTAIVEKEMSL